MNTCPRITGPYSLGAFGRGLQPTRLVFRGGREALVLTPTDVLSPKSRTSSRASAQQPQTFDTLKTSRCNDWRLDRGACLCRLVQVHVEKEGLRPVGAYQAVDGGLLTKRACHQRSAMCAWPPALDMPACLQASASAWGCALPGGPRCFGYASSDIASAVFVVASTHASLS